MAELWTQREDTGPRPYEVHGAMAYDSDRSVAVLSGQAKGNTGSRETWEWDGNSWVQVATWSELLVGCDGIQLRPPFVPRVHAHEHDLGAIERGLDAGR